MRLKTVFCGMTFAGLAAGSAAALAQQTTPVDPAASSVVVTPAPAAVVTSPNVVTAPAAGVVASTPAPGSYIIVQPYQTVPMYVDRSPDSSPSYGRYHAPDVG